MEHARRSMNSSKRAGSLPRQASTLGMVCCLTCLSALWTLSSASAQDEPAEPTVPDDVAENHFLDGLHWQVMASGFYLFNSNLVAGPYNNLDYPYTGYMGFGLNFAGGDLNYTGEKFGITIGLRFGSGAAQLSALDPIRQAFVSWMPHRKLTLDFGWFDTIYGAEVVDEWQNPTFTRGALYFLQQPFNHLGVRISATFTDWLALKLLVVNEEVGVGTIGGSSIDKNATPAFGMRLDFSPIDAVKIELGYLTGASGLNGNRAWGQFFDLILSARIRRFTLILNANTTLDPPVGSDRRSHGGALSGDMQLHEHWRIGARVEYLYGTVSLSEAKDPDLATFAAVVRYIPVQYLVISLEPRFELSPQELFFTRSSTTDPSTGDRVANGKTYFGLVLGVSAYIGN